MVRKRVAIRGIQDVLDSAAIAHERIRENLTRRLSCGRYDLQELVGQIPEDCQVKEIDWGRPMGKEVW